MEYGRIKGIANRAEAPSSNLPPAPPLDPQMSPPLELMKRPGQGQAGRRVDLLSNHFKVSFPQIKDSFHYHVTITGGDERGSADPRLVTNKTLSRKIIDKIKDSNINEFAYDGESSLFIIGKPINKLSTQFVVVLDDVKLSRRTAGEGSSTDTEQTKKRRLDRQKKFNVELKYAGKITMRTIQDVLRGEVCDHAQSALRVLDIILRQHASKRDCILIRQNFFDWRFAPLMELGGGVTGCPGYHNSFKPTQGGLTLNMDTSTTVLIKEDKVIDFLLQNQGLNNEYQINWNKAKQVLKGVRIKTSHTNFEYKIISITDLPCTDLRFLIKQSNGGDQERELTVFKYFQEKGFTLKNLPCLDVGRRNRPNYLPVELCYILPGQRYTKSLSSAQRSKLVENSRQIPGQRMRLLHNLVEKSRQIPGQRMRLLHNAMESNNYNSDPAFRACNINIDKQLVALPGRVLSAPELRFGEQMATRRDTPRNGRWNFVQKTMFRGAKISKWILVNFSISKFRNVDIRNLARDLQECCNRRGMEMAECSSIVEENPGDRYMKPADRVIAMRDRIRDIFPGEQDRPKFMICLLPERKNSDLYGPWKKMFLRIGVVNQCISPGNPQKITDQFLTNVAIKINAKMGGLNTVLNMEIEKKIPKISTIPTIIIGMDVSRRSVGNIDSPAIAAVVSSRYWPLISKYRASVRTQAPRAELIEDLCTITSTPELGERDSGMMNELLKDFYQTCEQGVDPKPKRMIIFRDGVSNSQFDTVLRAELKAILKACDFIESGYRPRVTLIIAQKNHHAKIFPTNGQEKQNVQPGTIVDSHICHPRNFDFYLCSQDGKMGTSRPTHYHVLLDENNFTVDELQSVVHALSYVYQKSTVAISTVAPINYAHLAASQMQQLLQAGERREGDAPQLPVPHPNISKTMYFC